jgi:hypothetical protein
MAGERRGHVLQTTALINEAFVRLIDWQVEWQNRAHFFGSRDADAPHTRAIRTRQHAVKRGGQAMQVSLSATVSDHTRNNPHLVALDDALSALEKLMRARRARSVAFLWRVESGGRQKCCRSPSARCAATGVWRKMVTSAVERNGMTQNAINESASFLIRRWKSALVPRRRAG